MRKTNTMGLINRVKSWLLPQTLNDDFSAAVSSSNGTAVAGFVQRMAADVEIVTSSNMTRSLAVLMPPALAAATPLRTIPLFLVPAAVELADVEIIQNVRPAPKLQLVHNIDRAVDIAQPTTTFMLAARLASHAQLNVVAGKKPFQQPQRQNARLKAQAQAKTTNRPKSEPTIAIKTSNTSKKQQCFVRPQATGKAIVVSVPKRAKRRVS
jgi:hypothetical protein